MNGATPQEEAGFVTLVRYTPDTPSGKATALFNTSSGALEVRMGIDSFLPCDARGISRSLWREITFCTDFRY